MLKRFTATMLAAFVAVLFVFYATLTSAAPAPGEAPFSIDQPALTEAEFVALPRPARTPQGAAPASSSDWKPIADQVFNALAFALVGWLLRIVSPIALRFGDWIGHRAEIEDLLRDDRRAALAKIVGEQALNLALGRLGYTREDLKDVRIRNAVFDFAARFVHDQWPEIWKWVDQNHNGQIDYFEAVTAERLPPVDLSNSAKRTPSAAVPA